ncbi:MAG: hypothetical protein GY844_14935 [Bradyrhizobium sp.]|nr:hypothetical protein [Bradyrhizobium sp.]
MRAALSLLSLACGLFCSALGLAVAGESEKQEKAIDTQFIFGFTSGADVGEVGERELEHQTAAQWSKRGGRYIALTDQLRFESSPLPNFRFEIGVPVTYYNIAGVSELADRNSGAFNGVQAEFRYRLLDREHSPVALTVVAEPHWNRREEISGMPVANYGGELTVVLDREFIRERLFGAINLIYDPEMTLPQPAGGWQRESALTLAGSFTAQVSPGRFIGMEARYIRKYDGLGLDTLSGQALFVGPNTFVRLSKSLAISGAWSMQVAGRSSDIPGSLDLTKFTRHQALLRLEYNF